MKLKHNLHKMSKTGGGVHLIGNILKEASTKLKNSSYPSDSPTLDAEILLAHCLKKNRTYLHTWPDVSVNESQLSCFNTLLLKRLDDYPVAYLLGKQSFWTLDLAVTEDVLIPRPETELLVETALDKISAIKNPKVLDLGTGSGAIALAIASERSDAQITASDYSLQALKIAKLNAKSANLISTINFIHSYWFQQIPKQKFDLIVSNPPYIDPSDPHLLQSIRHEPQQALIAEKSGMSDIEIIIKNSSDYLNKDCWLLLEHGFDQGDKTKAILIKSGFRFAETLKDLNNNQRVSLGQG